MRFLGFCNHKDKKPIVLEAYSISEKREVLMPFVFTIRTTKGKLRCTCCERIFIGTTKSAVKVAHYSEIIWNTKL